MANPSFEYCIDCRKLIGVKNFFAVGKPGYQCKITLQVFDGQVLSNRQCNCNSYEAHREKATTVTPD